MKDSLQKILLVVFILSVFLSDFSAVAYSQSDSTIGDISYFSDISYSDTDNISYPTIKQWSPTWTGKHTRKYSSSYST